MQSKTNVQDRVWVGTFQIVWNDFMDKIAFTKIKFPTGTPVIVNELNKQDFTVDELSEKCYYKYAGIIKKNTKKLITKAIKKKFNETSDILDQLDLTPGKDRFLVYAMLKKDFQFAAPFDKLGKSKFRDTEAEYFGIKSSSPKELDDTVEVLFYNNPSDFAVKLDTAGNDEVYLYKTANTKTFNLQEEMLFLFFFKVKVNNVLRRISFNNRYLHSTVMHKFLTAESRFYSHYKNQINFIKQRENLLRCSSRLN